MACPGSFWHRLSWDASAQKHAALNANKQRPRQQQKQLRQQHPLPRYCTNALQEIVALIIQYL